MMRRVLQAWAEDATEFARALAVIDPSWRSETFALAGGRVVLCGPGLYVNRALAVAVESPLSAADLDLLESRSAAVGVPAAVEVSPATDPDATALLARRGFRVDGEVTVLRRPLDDLDDLDDLEGRFDIVPADTDLLPLWQATSALGWGHVDDRSRRAADAFARAAAVVDGDGLVLATDAGDRRPVGCASLTVRDGVATLGGMSTVPAERRRGVQAALVAYRLRRARALGCEVATSSVRPGGDSERNLIRLGFEPWFTIVTLVRSGDR